MHLLMIKKCSHCNLKYLCKTSSSKINPYSYAGSGIRWLNHLKAHKSKTITCVVGTYDSKEQLREAGLWYSSFYDVVASDEWANLTEEKGDGGLIGSGQSGKRWKIKDTSNMKGGQPYKGRPGSEDRIEKTKNRMIGDNNPSRRFERTDNQINASKLANKIRTEASKKRVLVKYSDGSEKIFSSKRELCSHLSISYDIINYRIDKDRHYNDMLFYTVPK